MVKAKQFLVNFLLSFLVVSTISCGGGEGGSSGEGEQPIFEAQSTFAPVQGDSPSEYQVINSYDTVTPDVTGISTIPISKIEHTFTYAISDSGNKVYAAVTTYNQSSFNIDAKSTAEALVLLNPLLIPSNKEDYLELIHLVRSDMAVSNLASIIDNLYYYNEDPLSNEQLINAVSDAVISVLNSMQVSSVFSRMNEHDLSQVRQNDNVTIRTTINTFPIIRPYDMGALTLANTSDTTINIDIAEVGPGGIKTNVTWISEIIELDPAEINWVGDEFIFLPGSIDNLIQTGGYRQKVIIEGEIASGFLGFLVDPLGWIGDVTGGFLFPDEGISPGKSGIYAVIASSGSPFGDSSEYESIKDISWQWELWKEALSINIIAIAMDVIGTGFAIVGVEDISPVLKEQFILIEFAITDNPEKVGVTFIIDQAIASADNLQDFLKPYIHSGISDWKSGGLKKFLRIPFESAKRVLDTWSGTIQFSTRILNFLLNVTPRESGYVILNPSLPAPAISDIAPDLAQKGTEVTFTLTGTGFQASRKALQTHGIRRRARLQACQHPCHT